MMKLRRSLRCILVSALIVTTAMSCQKKDDDKKILAESVSLDQVEISMVEGTSENLIATVNPTNVTDATVKWKTTDTDIATVDESGKVTAIKEGKAEITATTIDGSKSAICKVTVNSAVIKVASIKLNKTVLELLEGSSSTLTCSILPKDATNKKHSWESSNTSVATVSTAGKVTAVKAGTATITVTSEDGAKKANCSLTVKPAAINVESISMLKELSIKVGEESDLMVKVLPENATDKEYTITTTNDDIVFFASGSSEIIGNEAGVVTITATTTDGNKVATCIVTVIAPIESTCIDPDGRKYKTIVVGEQEWMSENYAYLPNFFTADKKNAEEARCYVPGYAETKEEAIESDEYKKYGAFYNLKAAIEYCPKGWHLPTDAEWKELEMFLGMSKEDADIDGYGKYRGEVGKKLKSTEGWDSEGNGDNTSGLNVLPAGTHGFSSIFYIGGKAMFLTSTIDESYPTDVYTRMLFKSKLGVQRDYTATEKGCSVRYIKDKE